MAGPIFTPIQDLSPQLWRAIVNEPGTLNDIVVTSKLASRPHRWPEFEAENKALRKLSRVVATAPAGLLDTLLQLALELCHAGSAGISILQTAANGEQTYLWTNLAGAYKNFVGGSTPRNFSPCGVTTDRGYPQLFSYPARYFTYFRDVDPPLVEGLVLPLPVLATDQIEGTIWVVSHDEATGFDTEDVRLMTSLAEFAGAILLMNRLVDAEQQARQIAEFQVEKRTAALRKLSARLIQAQDAERRRVARNLHDSVGQYLASLNMNLDLMGQASGEKLSRLIVDCKKSVAECISETRTISHLLHPPLLDEAGLTSATRLFVEEFSRRSGMPVECEISPGLGRLPDAIEIAVFRVLQESLTNIHRHSGSARARIDLDSDGKVAMLKVTDYGCGVSEEVLNSFRHGGRSLGVGLSGMIERIRELGGELDMQSGASGTTVMARVPLPPDWPSGDQLLNGTD